MGNKTIVCIDCSQPFKAHHAAKRCDDCWEKQPPQARAFRRYRNTDRAKQSRRARRYGLSLCEMNEHLAKGCEVCGSHSDLCIDHCHKTGVFRGVLCRACNVALGFMNDDPMRIRSLAAYAGKHST